MLGENVIAKLELEEYAYQRYQDSFKTVPHAEGESREEKRRREVSYLNIRWFMQTLLDRMDRMDRACMSCGLEARVPFADHRIFEYLYNVPWDMRYRGGVEKALLRYACVGLLPEEILYRNKFPYQKTNNPAYERILSLRFRAVLDDKEAPIHRFVDRIRQSAFSLPQRITKKTDSVSSWWVRR